MPFGMNESDFSHGKPKELATEIKVYIFTECIRIIACWRKMNLESHIVWK